MHIRSYGIDKVMQHSHASTWRDWNDRFTLRVHAAPQKGGDAMLKWYVQAQNKLGWLQGAYTNYTDYDPINENWNPDNVQRMPDGEWRRAFTRTYALKPAKAVEFDDYPLNESSNGMARKCVTRMSTVPYPHGATAILMRACLEWDFRGSLLRATAA